MRDYAKVSPLFWTRGSGKRLRGDADGQVLALYLVTCPAANMIGIYYVPLVAIAHETGLGIERATQATSRLATAGFAFYDDEHELAWVPNMASYQIGDELKVGDKRRGGPIRAELDKIGRHPYVRAFWNRYGEAYGLGVCPLDHTSTPEPSPLQGPPKGDALHSGRAGEEQEKSRSIGASAGAPAVAAVAAPPTPPILVVQDGRPDEKKAKRDPVIAMREDWQPTQEHLDHLRAQGLRSEDVVEDFRAHWIAERKRKNADDWSATFRQNISRILRTDWLLEKFRMGEGERARAAWPDDPPPPPEREYTAAEIAAIDARLEAAMRPSPEIGFALTADPPMPGDPRLPPVFAGGGT